MDLCGELSKQHAADIAAGLDASTCTPSGHRTPLDEKELENQDDRTTPACRFQGIQLENKAPFETALHLNNQAEQSIFVCLQNRHSCLSTGTFSASVA